MAGVLMTINGHGPTPSKEILTITGGGSQPLPLLSPRPGARTRLLFWLPLNHVLVVPPGGSRDTRTSGYTLALPKHHGQLNDSRCNSSITEAGVLIAYHQATARPLPNDVRTITGPSITIPPGEASAR
ncbi:hypothetical protein AVEN_205838-1 [Araneus ventricosus]|uniref:Uncharacterized protein n=1 Tax=Araneus ventricosus TaxID=182803 RepID=A0A4Y2HDW4_ARAVE|nr:hypothetical protein AVEN_205838-1 [Araneus ventricosus]